MCAPRGPRSRVRGGEKSASGPETFPSLVVILQTWPVPNRCGRAVASHDGWATFLTPPHGRTHTVMRHAGRVRILRRGCRFHHFFSVCAVIQVVMRIQHIRAPSHREQWHSHHTHHVYHHDLATDERPPAGASRAAGGGAHVGQKGAGALAILFQVSRRSRSSSRLAWCVTACSLAS